MASVVTEAGGRRLIQLSPSEHPNRPKLRLGKVSKREAESARIHVENLLRGKVTGSAYPPATAEWLAGLPVLLRRRLERFGLIEPQERRECPTLAEWLKTYVRGRRDVKDTTATVYGHMSRNLLAFFGKSKRLDEITPGEADGFRVYLKTQERLADNTVRRRMGIAKQFLRAAVRRKLIPDNPERLYFVSREEAEAVLDACPTAQWRLVFALCRYGGLRCASEVARLKWGDVNWEKMRFTVHASKTEHEADAGIRVVPVFPELYPHLREAFEEAQPGAVYCCPQFPHANQMYRKYIVRFIRQAGLKPWPKLFQNLRSSRETELAEKYPVHVACAWIGNSPQVAAKHYLQVTESHFAKAVRNPVQNPAASACTDPQANGEPEAEAAVCGAMRNEAAPCEDTEPQPLGRSGLEPLTSCVSSRRSSHLS
jgi:integrase